MRRSATPRLRTYAVLAVVALLGSLASGRPELAALAAPFAVLLVIGLTLSHDLDLDVEVRLERDRAIEGEEIKLFITALTDPAGARLEFELDLLDGVELAPVGGGARTPAVIQGTTVTGFEPESPAPRHLDLTLRCLRWGAYRIGHISVRSRDSVGLFDYTAEVPVGLSFKVFPESATVRQLLAPLETRLGFGDIVSRHKGPGLEFADLRPMVHGDDPRQINWRVTGRGSDVWVNDRHPERNSEVVLLVDTFSRPQRGVDVTVDLAVKAAAALAADHLRRNDRVGLISFGEPLRWLRPGMGDVQRYRILDTLMESRSSRQVHWNDVSAVPRRALPAKALVIGLSPLLDDRAVNAFADLRGRGFDLAVVEIPAEHFVAEPITPEDRMARRIWELQRQNTRERFLRHGIATARWNPDDPFQHALAEVRAFRQKAKRALV